MLAQGDCNCPGASVQHGILFDTSSDMDLHKRAPVISVRVHSCMFLLQIHVSKEVVTANFRKKKSKNGPYPLEAFGLCMTLKVSIKSMPCSPGIPEGLLIVATVVPEEFVMTNDVVV